jgi:predicted HTH domain antitoxin
MRIEVDLPDELAGRAPRELAQELRMYAVFAGWQRGDLSTGRAARLLGLGRAAFLLVAAKHGFPSMDQSAEELQDDLGALDGLL